MGKLPLSGVTVAYAALEPFPNAKGSGTRVTQLVGALANAGARVHLLTLPGRDVHVHLPNGVEHRALHVPETNFLRRALSFRDRVRRELVALRPDVLHFRGVFEGEAALRRAADARIPCVFEVNGLPSVELAYHYPSVAAAPHFLNKLRLLEAHLLGRVELVITQSRTTLTFLRQHGLASSTAAAVIPNGADPAAYPGDDGTSRSRARVLYAGTMAPWQGVSELLMAMRRVARETPVLLSLAGPVRTRWRKQLERSVRRLGIAGDVELCGPLARDALARKIAASDVCVAPLRRDRRNFGQGSSPIKLFEYMAAGRALVSTDLACVREIVTHEETGLLAASSRPSMLAEQILRLVRDESLRASLGGNARARILHEATWAHRAAALTAEYAKLLGCAR